VSIQVTSRFVVVNSTPDMAAALERIQELSFPDLAPLERMQAAHYRTQIQTFPEGQLAVLDQENGEVVACSSDLRCEVDFAHYQHPYLEAVGHNTFSTHQPQGSWLYGADIGVHPDYRGMRLSSLLYQARHALIRRLELKGHVVGAMPKGYGAVQNELSIEQYLLSVVRGERRDPVVSVLLKRGYAPYGIIPDYLLDASCGNFGIFMIWRG
jgi:GNAT superfamily N-acetyltransferase